MKLLLTLLFLFSLHTPSCGQNLHLQVKIKDQGSLSDSINYRNEFKNIKELKKEVSSVQKRFIKKGQIDVFHKLIKKNDSLYICDFFLGLKIKQIKINIPKEVEKVLPKKYKNKKEFTIEFQNTENFLQTLNEEIANQGQPFNSLFLKNIEKRDTILIGTLQKNINQKRTIDNIIIKGYEKFPKSYLKNFLNIRKGRIFNKKKIDKNIKKIKNLDFAKSTRTPEVLFTKDSTTLYLFLQKKNSNTFDGFLGFSNEEESNNLQLNGYINLKLKNNLNYGEELTVEYKNNGDKLSLFFANLKLPFLFNTPLGTEASLRITRQDSTFSTTNQKIGINYQILPELITGINYETENSKSLENTSTAVQTNQEDYETNYLNFKTEYSQKHNNELFNNKIYGALEAGIGKRISLNEKTDQQKIKFSANKIFNINKRNFIYIANHTGFINSENYLNNELFRTGGIQNLRGFQENSIITNFYTFFNTEYRYLLDQNLYTHSIFDFGKFENQNQKTDTNVYSIGIGLGLKTRSGLLKLLIANGKTNNQNFEFKNTKVHLSLTTQF
ncbi:hypothetical protein KW502_10460 [Mesonia sp. JHPTF-M18]|uniref:POTRA domain-containing protein n=1 Tax=Mesonia aestuariivivens TaxID=2796128 RepID=A0ABS6W3V0_9FLAO|nr:hypothetical protein [Mesonia aestuariivivens]